jgi:hypothetical protein
VDTLRSTQAAPLPMTLARVVSCLCLLGLSGCSARPDHRFRDLVDVEGIESVTVHNNAGQHRLNPAELRRFKNTLGRMRFCPEASLKMGAIGLTLVLRGHAYYIAGRTRGEYVEVPRELVSQHREALGDPNDRHGHGLLFKFTEPVNLDNYR